MRFHVSALPHTEITRDFCWCAYTAKILKFCNMMTSLGHEVYLYGYGSKTEANVTEYISVISDDDHKKWFGHYDWNTMVFADWDSGSPCWKGMNGRVITEIYARKQPGDFLCLIAGVCQEELKTAFPEMMAVEWGIGYEGILMDAHHVFESYAWMHYVYGQKKIADGRFFDTVIPNSFDQKDFVFEAKKQDYLLYLGRPTERKGIQIVRELVKRGIKVVTAGQGNPQIAGAEHIGVVRGIQKAELIANARALLAPTLYIEPFGGVAVEAMLSGTPVITTDFGAFTETVRHGIDGYRCHTLAEFIKATELVDDLDRTDIMVNALQYPTENIRFKYQEYFKRLQLLEGQGWYQL